MERNIVSISIGQPKSYVWNGKTEDSGIGKQIIEEAFLTTEGFVGDGVANQKYHGGPDRAVCVYPYEHYLQFEKEFNKSIEPPAFGENITVRNMLEKDIFIGDIFALGDAIVQVSQGRIPCNTISKFNEIDSLLSRFVETGYTGYFFKVIKEGAVNCNSEIKLIERAQNNVSIWSANQVLFHDKKNKEAIEEILKCTDLANAWKGKAGKLLKNLT
ncbi:MOSC domain-containing protein [Bacillus sp. SM2101]|uniref:MOSC domain-containing protein n=1 Tax=Bacillaceae TaxID=186817 RepID=UPI001BDE0793|nr:MOSC domain-containing protein [Bacillus sp. SM2101]